MRIALITDGIWPYVLGGMQKHSYYLCKYLAQQQIHVDLFHYNRSTYDISQLEVFSPEEKKYITSIIVDFPKSVSFPGHYLYNSYRHSKRIFQVISKQLDQYDFIYTKGFTGWYLINQKQKRNVNCAPVGVKFHGYEMFQQPPDLKTQLQAFFLLRKPVKAISKNADVVFSYGGKITEIIRSIGVEESKIFVLPSGVESSFVTDKVNTTGAKVRFLFLGRYERRKGIEELNKAIALINSDVIAKVELHFIGPIPEGKKINAPNVTYHGEIRDKSQLREKISSCDVLICPSWSEGMPNVILEAMSLGLALVATDVGATNVLVNNQTGWLLKSSNPEEICATLHKVIDSKPTEIDQKKQTALDTIRGEFTWEKLVTRLITGLFAKFGSNSRS